MADTCYLCEMGDQNLLRRELAPGGGFGTCYECNVHACRRHGERARQYFRCADCIAAEGATAALTPQAEHDVAGVIGEAPRLSMLARDARRRFDSRRLGAAVGWVRRRVLSDERLLEDAGEGERVERRVNAALALGLPTRGDDPALADDVLGYREAMVEARVRELIWSAGLGDDEMAEGEAMRAGELAAASLAVAYGGRDVEDPELSPFDFRGGLTLPPAVIVLGHAYAHANHFFW